MVVKGGGLQSLLELQWTLLGNRRVKNDVDKRLPEIIEH